MPKAPKVNGAEKEPSPKKHVHDHGDSECSEHEPFVPALPENIYKRLNALKNLHLDVQNIRKEYYRQLFLLEAEYNKKLAHLYQKRAEIVTGKYEPTEQETKFSLRDDEVKPEMLPNDGEAGVPRFWLEALVNNNSSRIAIQDHDEDVLANLTDIQVTYLENPLGFKLDFHFKENEYFNNSVLSRTYLFGEETSKLDMFENNTLTPVTTSGTKIEWKEGKNITKKKITSTQRNKKTGERREVTREEKQESFFNFFEPEVTDLKKFTEESQAMAEDDQDEELQEKIEAVEDDYEMASSIRTNVVPRAVLFFTGEDDDVYSDEEDYDFEDEEDDEEDESDSEEDAPPQPPKKALKGAPKK